MGRCKCILIQISGIETDNRIESSTPNLKTRLRPSDEAKTREDTTVFDHLVHSELTDAQFGRGGFTRLAQVNCV